VPHAAIRHGIAPHVAHQPPFLRELGQEPWKAAYVQPSRRPKDRPVRDNQNRRHLYFQFQVVR